MVYAHLLMVGKVFYTPNRHERHGYLRFKDYEKYAAPSLSILRVCKQINREAQEVYLKNNLFVLPENVDISEMIVSRGSQNASSALPHRSLFSGDGSLVKNISVGYTPRHDVPITMNYNAWNRLHSRVYQPAPETHIFKTLRYRRRLRKAHRVAQENLTIEWKATSKRLFLAPFHLDELELDLSEAFCTLGCCRNFDLDLNFIQRWQPARIRVLGVFKGEKQTIQTMISNTATLSMAYLMQTSLFSFGRFIMSRTHPVYNTRITRKDISVGFNVEESKWDKWKVD